MAPFVGDERLQAFASGPGQGAERIAVEINDAFGQLKPLAETGQGITRITLGQGVAGE